MLACGALFGLIALLLIESLRFFERTLRRFEHRPYWLAAAGGVALMVLYFVAGDAYAGLGTDTINGVLTGATSVFAGAFLLKILPSREGVYAALAAATAFLMVGHRSCRAPRLVLVQGRPQPLVESKCYL